MREPVKSSTKIYSYMSFTVGTGEEEKWMCKMCDLKTHTLLNYTFLVLSLRIEQLCVDITNVIIIKNAFVIAAGSFCFSMYNNDEV